MFIQCMSVDFPTLRGSRNQAIDERGLPHPVGSDYRDELRPVEFQHDVVQDGNAGVAELQSVNLYPHLFSTPDLLTVLEQDIQEQRASDGGGDDPNGDTGNADGFGHAASLRMPPMQGSGNGCPNR